MVFCEFDNPTSLSSSDILWLVEVFQVLVIGVDFEYLVCAHEVVSPFFECEHYCEHLLVVYFVVSLGVVKRFREIGDRMPFVVLFLAEYGAYGVITAVGFESELSFCAW